MGLDKYSVASRRCRGPGQYRRQHAITAATVSSTARTLNRMRGVKNDRITKFPDPIERTHIRDEVVDSQN